MKSRHKVIASFVVLALVIWLIEFALDYLMPHTGLLDTAWYATVAVIPPVTLYSIIAIRVISQRRQVEEKRKLSLHILELLNQAGDLAEIKHQLLLLIKEFSGCEAVGIRLQAGEDFPYTNTVGFVAGHVQAENYLCTIDEKGEIVRDSEGDPVLGCMCGNIIRGRFNPQKPFFTEGGSFWTNSTTELLASTTEEELLTVPRNRCHSEGYESLALIPLTVNGANVGLLQLNSKRRKRFTPELIEFYEIIAHSIGVLLRRRQAEETLRASEQNFRNSIGNSPLGIRVITIEGELLYVNQAMLDIWGYDSFEELKSTPAEKRVTPETYAGVLERRKLRKLGKPAPDHYELDIVRKDGELRRVSVQRSEVLWNGNMQHQLIYQDITEHKRMEKQLRHSQLLASLGEMTAGIAHEVNNPLGSILLYSELLLASDIPRQVQKDVRVIRNEAKRAARIMTDLLTYGRKTKSHLRRLDLHNVLRKVIKMRRYREKVNNITASTNLLDDPLYVKGDSSQLMQVFMNLILNAEEAVREPKGGNIIITTRIDEKWAKVSIADDGPGIPQENLSRVFHPFFTTKEVGEGTGLGLSTCYGIVTNHHGLIHAENNKMGGATFMVELPLAESRRQGSLPKKLKKASLLIT